MASNNSEGGSGVAKRKHKSTSIQDKVEILKKLDSCYSVRRLCDLYCIGSSTVYDIKKNKNKIIQFFTDSDTKKQMSIRKSMKDGKSSEHDRVMMEWFRQRRGDGVDLSGPVVLNLFGGTEPRKVLLCIHRTLRNINFIKQNMISSKHRYCT